MAAGARRRARRYALQVLYALDVNPLVEPDRALADYAGSFELELDDTGTQFARELVMETRAHQQEIDDVIQSASRNWRLERMSRVDRNILRVATYELRFQTAVPVKVVINEAVELAKRFSSTEAPAFVNGILDRIAQNLRRE